MAINLTKSEFADLFGVSPREMLKQVGREQDAKRAGFSSHAALVAAHRLERRDAVRARQSA